MSLSLPPSLDRNRHGVAEEVAWARGLSPEERLAIVASLCRDAVQLLLLNDKRERVLSLRDPVPESTRRALARLRMSDDERARAWAVARAGAAK